MAVLTITGHIGSDKTTVAKLLSQCLGWRHHYVGGVTRELAQQKGTTIEKFYEELKNNPELEKEIDRFQADLMQKENNIIVEGRMAFFFPSPFQKINIFLKVEEAEGAKRQKKRPENQNRSVEEILTDIRHRVQNERERYYNLYGIADHLDERNFQIVIDTNNKTADEVVELILESLKALIQ